MKSEVYSIRSSFPRIFGLLGMVLLTFSCSGDDAENIINCLGESAFVRIEIENDNGDRTVGFSIDYTGDLVVRSVEWEFGDGNSGNGTSVSHTYTAAGSFTVKAIVELRDGDAFCKPEKTRNVTVE